MKDKNLCWSKYTSLKQFEEIDEPVDSVMCVFCAAVILILALLSFVFIGLSL